MASFPIAFVYRGGEMTTQQYGGVGGNLGFGSAKKTSADFEVS